ncbi:Uncharacterised protein [Mycobacteroides abscessus subsp. abscessus]|nr:Uncharacterised protein [Mycobacteroides abscessus subsp. abscessus]
MGYPPSSVSSIAYLGLIGAPCSRCPSSKHARAQGKRGRSSGVGALPLRIAISS